MIQRIYWTGICHDTRLNSIGMLEECINRFGSIIEHKFFSDISISLVIEIEEQKVMSLYEALSKFISLSEQTEVFSLSSKECTLLLNITFTQGSGNLRVDVIDFPG